MREMRHDDERDDTIAVEGQGTAVIGAGTGLGRVPANRLVGAGARVVMKDVDVTACDATAALRRRPMAVRHAAATRRGRGSTALRSSVGGPFGCPGTSR